jgi:hypothetical protein
MLLQRENLPVYLQRHKEQNDSHIIIFEGVGSRSGTWLGGLGSQQPGVAPLPPLNRTRGGGRWVSLKLPSVAAVVRSILQH